MTTETNTRRPLFPATAAVWRFITRPIRWLWRRKLKITLWTATLITLGWQYENWHGRREYKEQIALFRAEYGDLKWQDFAPPRIPDEENFFAAPVFETFVVKEPRTRPPRRDGQTEEEYEYHRKCDEMADALPQSRFLRIRLPQLASVEREVPRLAQAEGLELLDIAAWAKAETSAGKVRPDRLTDAQWLHSGMPEDATVRGLMEAAVRSRAQPLPHLADRRHIGEALNDPAAIPLCAVSGLYGAAQTLGLRARTAARAGDGRTAEQQTTAILLLAQGYLGEQSLITSLIGIALEAIALEATAEGIAARCWDAHALTRLAARLTGTDEEGTLFNALYVEGFQYHIWPGDIRAWHRRAINAPRAFRWKPLDLYLWACAKGPDGWVEANLGTHLRWWRGAMVPNKPGDDLHMLGNVQMNLARAVTASVRWLGLGVPSPRSVWATIAVPAMSGVCANALNNQTRRRQLLLAIAIERHLLAKGALPQQPADLVPAFIDAIPGDPWQPGTPLRWEVPDKAREVALRPGAQAIRYRILSAGQDTTLGFPEKLP